ncbi:glucan endo-1,3-beta-glucosidase isoform X2 [Magnolia sinica]|uniref:glucan endo-1,3-beta-glucosidase isoform X2 n=1 Tax=Magnolia sinica TaxID=86752 RepID=UPI002657D9B1|nr:glucan endo-1,3-beta-glucosidase isoform X2 [Magnolia sinica]
MAKTVSSATVAVTTMANISFIVTTISLIGAVQGMGLGINYGTVANNLPPPARVAQFLLQSTSIDRIKLFDANPTILQAFADTGIAVTVTVANDQIPQLTNLEFANQWLRSNILPYTPTTNIIRILVGNEVVSTADKSLIAGLVPAMQNLHTALVAESLDNQIKVSTPHSLGILSTSYPPSNGQFRRRYDIAIFEPLLGFLNATGSPFMINPYPFFGLKRDVLDYALFRPNPGVYDQNTRLTYSNMLDGQLDAIFTAMKRLGFADVEIVIAETGWPSEGEPGQIGVSVESAADYNRNLIQHVNSGLGTPLMPNRTFETYIFALFNENLKPGPTIERNFGLFRPDMTPVYDVGIQKPVVMETASTALENNGQDVKDGRAERSCGAAMRIMLMLHFTMVCISSLM